ncbi:hypothetical protein PGB90_007854 [Kerria lacca]
MTVEKELILKLYKSLLREGNKFSSYNFRMYALRRIRSRFKEEKIVKDPVKVELCYKEGLKNLDIIKRQVIINDLYKPEKLVLENRK